MTSWARELPSGSYQRNTDRLEIYMTRDTFERIDEYASSTPTAPSHGRVYRRTFPNGNSYVYFVEDATDGLGGQQHWPHRVTFTDETAVEELPPKLRTINHELVCSHNDLLVALVRMEDLEREARKSWGAFERHVTTRCVNMAQHANGLPMPCGECYSLESFWRPIPYEPESSRKGEYPGPIKKGA